MTQRLFAGNKARLESPAIAQNRGCPRFCQRSPLQFHRLFPGSNPHRSKVRTSNQSRDLTQKTGRNGSRFGKRRRKITWRPLPPQSQRTNLIIMKNRPAVMMPPRIFISKARKIGRIPCQVSIKGCPLLNRSQYPIGSSFLPMLYHQNFHKRYRSENRKVFLPAPTMGFPPYFPPVTKVTCRYSPRLPVKLHPNHLRRSHWRIRSRRR